MSVTTLVTKDVLLNLRKRWAAFALFLVLLATSGFIALQSWWGPAYARTWLTLTSSVLAYELWMLWRGLHENRRHHESFLLPRLGAGNVASLVRGGLIGLLYGFLFLPRPDGWLAWAPGVIYTVAVLIDFVDGYLARMTHHVTRLGEILDMNLDGLGVLVSTLLIVQYNQVPWWYLAVGLARYLFLAGMWIYRRLGKPTHVLPPSYRRRGLAGLQMGFIFVMLYPVFSPPGTHIAALAFGIPFLVSFLWDWLIVIGKLPAATGVRYPALKSFVLNEFPLVLRLGILFLLGRIALTGLTMERLSIGSPGVVLIILEAVVILLIALGVAGRGAAILGLVLVGFRQISSILITDQYLLVFLYTMILILGTGRFSLWKPEERLIFHRLGERSLLERD